MPILGIMASQISGHLWQPEGAYDSLATVTLSANTNSVTFSGIPSGYKHLQIRLLTLGSLTTASSGYTARAQFNGDTASSYNRHELSGDGSSANAFGPSTSQTYFNVGTYVTNAVGTPIGASIIDVLDYSNTNKNKTVKSLAGSDANGAGNITLYSGLWRSTNAITSITITAATAGDFATYSSFALYGVK